MLLFCLMCFVLAAWDNGHSKKLPPVILMPGDGGTRIEAKLNKSTHGPRCDAVTKKFYTIWVNVESVLTPVTARCFIDNFRLVYDKKTRTTKYPDGVKIKIPDFGDTEAVEYLSDCKISEIGYYDKIVKEMVKWGYVRNKTVRGAPYDFRKSPNELNELYTNLTMLIEETYGINNNTRVVLIAHSLGNLVLLYFLNHKPQEWKDKYINSFITLAAPWGGSLKALKMVVSGDDINIFTVRSLQARALQRSLTSSYFLLPSSEFWNKSEVLIQSPKRNYTVEDYTQLFTDLNITDGILMREDTKRLTNPLRPPNVVVHCLYGYGLNTASGYIYNKQKWSDHNPDSVKGDGDKTVSIRSLQGCLPWKHVQNQPLYSKAFKGIGHTDMLTHNAVIEHLRGILIPN